MRIKRVCLYYGDFDPTNMNLQIKRDGKGVPLPLPQQNLEQINIQGDITQAGPNPLVPPGLSIGEMITREAPA